MWPLYSESHHKHLLRLQSLTARSSSSLMLLSSSSPRAYRVAKSLWADGLLDIFNAVSPTIMDNVAMVS